jgi:hypothetical protein
LKAGVWAVPAATRTGSVAVHGPAGPAANRPVGEVEDKATGRGALAACGSWTTSAPEAFPAASVCGPFADASIGCWDETGWVRLGTVDVIDVWGHFRWAASVLLPQHGRKPGVATATHARIT